MDTNTDNINTGTSVETLVELDARGRASLGKIAGSHTRFIARAEEGGVLILEPAVLMTEAQLRLERRPELAAQLAVANARPEGAVPFRRRTARVEPTVLAQ